jgi:integrase/recombinase XerD
MASIYTRRNQLHIGYKNKYGKRKAINLKLDNNAVNYKKAEKIKHEIEGTIENKYLRNVIGTPEDGVKSEFLSLNDSIEKFRTEHMVLTTSNNQRNFNISMKHLFRVISPESDIKNVTAAHISKLIGLLKNEVSNASLHTYLRYIKSLFNYLIEEGIVEKSPVKRKDVPKKEKKKVIVFGKDLHKIILNEAKERDINFFNVLMMFGLTGGRPCDILRLKDTHFNFENEVLRLYMSKTKKEIIFPIYKELKEFINEYMPEIYEQKGELIFPHFTVNSVGMRFRRVKRKLNITERFMYTLKTFRKTFATSMSENGIMLQELSELLGHESVETSKQFYTHVSVDRLKDKMNKIHKKNPE